MELRWDCFRWACSSHGQTQKYTKRIKIELFSNVGLQGALFGSIMAMALITVMCIGQQMSIANGDFQQEVKQTSIEHCPCMQNNTMDSFVSASTENFTNELVNVLYRISYIWYSAIGFLTTITLGMLGSFVTGFENPGNVNTDLLSPPIRNFFLQRYKKAVLNIPLKQSNDNNVKNDDKGVINVGLQINDEKYDIKMNGIEQNKVRKISAPS